MPSKLWDVTDSLVTLFTDGLTIPVFDGPQPRKSTPPKEFLIVGTDGGDSGFDSIPEALAVEQEWATISCTGRREERGSVTCAAWAWSGSNTVAELRAKVKVTVAACEDLLLANRGLDGLLTAAPGGFGVEFSRLSIWQTQYIRGEGTTNETAGTAVRAAFAAVYQTRVNPTP